MCNANPLPAVPDVDFDALWANANEQVAAPDDVPDVDLEVDVEWDNLNGQVDVEPVIQDLPFDLPVGPAAPMAIPVYVIGVEEVFDSDEDDDVVILN